MQHGQVTNLSYGASRHYHKKQTTAVISQLGSWIESLGINEFTIDEVTTPAVLASILCGAIGAVTAGLLERRGEWFALVIGALGMGLAVPLLCSWRAPSVWQLEQSWHYVPPCTALVAITGLLEFIPWESSRWKWLLRASAIQMVACLLIPRGTGWTDWEPYRLWWLLGIGQAALWTWALLDSHIESNGVRLAAWVQLVVLGLATLVVGQSFASLKDFGVVGGAFFGAAAAVTTVIPSRSFWKGVWPGYAFFLSALMGTGDFYDSYGYPLGCFVLVLAAPLVVVVTGWLVPGRFTGLRVATCGSLLLAIVIIVAGLIIGANTW